jgi:hypothetical protein
MTAPPHEDFCLGLDPSVTPTPPACRDTQNEVRQARLSGAPNAPQNKTRQTQPDDGDRSRLRNDWAFKQRYRYIHIRAAGAEQPVGSSPHAISKADIAQLESEPAPVLKAELNRIVPD